MNLGIVGTGAMGQTLLTCAKADTDIERIFMIEPMQKESWPKTRVDLLIDFSHPQAICAIYDYCRACGGNIPVVLATTGYSKEDEEIIRMLQKICPVDRRTNFSQGIAAMNELAELGAARLGDKADIRVVEAHHMKKADAPSGTAKSLGHHLGIPEADYPAYIASLRMGNVFGQHTVYFAMEDELLEIRHTAYSKRIFALGALEAGKQMVQENMKQEC